jgi:GMP synthase-like glutamine amidotransferase
MPQGIAILETGTPPGELGKRFGRYSDMFAELLGQDLITAVHDVTGGEFPDPAGQSAWLITGSSAGVYDDLPWIEPLKQFLRAAKGRAKLVGICFGHQIMAEAFGGRVEKSEKGWGLGLHTYRVVGHERWMDDAERIAVPVSHQDQVVEQPPHSHLLATNDFCEIAALAYEDQPAISFQFHPEFTPEFAAELIELRRARAPNADAAIASLAHPNDRQRVASWIRHFLEG